MTVCIQCGSSLPAGPQVLSFIEPDATRFPLSAAREKPFSYRLCRSCEKAFGPHDRQALEVRIISAFEAGLMLAQLAEHIESNVYRTDPGVRAAAEGALGVHKRYYAQAGASMAALLALIEPLRAAKPSARALLGQGWFESLEALLAAHEHSLQQSQEAAALIRQRLASQPSPIEPGA
jgi:hypothetical protein